MAFTIISCYAICIEEVKECILEMYLQTLLCADRPAISLELTKVRAIKHFVKHGIVTKEFVHSLIHSALCMAMHR